MQSNDNTIEFLESFLDNEFSSFGSNLRSFLVDYKKKTKRLDTIMRQNDKQQLQLLKVNEELDEYKNHLEHKVEEEIKKREEKEKMLLQQSKLAAMGEMMDAVAHQWKQPINIINMQVDMMGYDYEDKLIDQKYVDEFQQKVSSQVKHMTSTLNEFRSFFRPNKEESEFDIKAMVDKVLLLVKDEFIKNKIQINLNCEQNFDITGVENEFKHVLINILNNAKDALNENTVKDKKITITTKIEEGMNKIYILDNAGGIPEFIIDDIFDANVTSKAQSNGTGIGLYMSKLIVEKYNGTIIVENDRKNNGALFTITFNNQD